MQNEENGKGQPMGLGDRGGAGGGDGREKKEL